MKWLRILARIISLLGTITLLALPYTYFVYRGTNISTDIMSLNRDTVLLTCAFLFAVCCPFSIYAQIVMFKRKRTYRAIDEDLLDDLDLTAKASPVKFKFMNTGVLAGVLIMIVTVLVFLYDRPVARKMH